jgi:hypothetical protein
MIAIWLSLIPGSFEALRSLALLEAVFLLVIWISGYPIRYWIWIDPQAKSNSIGLPPRDFSGSGLNWEIAGFNGFSAELFAETFTSGRRVVKL